ncbi:MAG: tetratricopeptide repeat protein [Bryobacteraceae bacterium]
MAGWRTLGLLLALRLLAPGAADLERLIDSGDLARARHELKTLVAQSGETARTLFLEAVILHRERRYVESLERLQSCLRKDPDRADGYKLAGLNLVALGREAFAGPYFENAAELAPADPKAQYYLGLHYLTRKSFPEAEPPLRRAVKLDPRDLDARCVLGIVLEQLGREPEAAREYEEAIRLERTARHRNAKPFLYLGRLHFGAERYQQSVEVLSIAAGIAPADVEVLVSLGQALEKAERSEEGEARYLEAARLAPDDKRPHFHLMRIYRSRRMTEKALYHMRRFRELEETSAQAK